MDKPGHIETLMGNTLEVTKYDDYEVAFSDGLDTIFIHVTEIDDIVTYLMYYKKWWEEKYGTPDA